MFSIQQGVYYITTHVEVSTYNTIHVPEVQQIPLIYWFLHSYPNLDEKLHRYDDLKYHVICYVFTHGLFMLHNELQFVINRSKSIQGVHTYEEFTTHSLYIFASGDRYVIIMVYG